MTERLHILVSAEDKERYRREAERVGTSLGGWIREAAEAYLARSAEEHKLNSPEALDEFFRQRDEVDQAPEPDWEEHRVVIKRSQVDGALP